MPRVEDKNPRKTPIDQSFISYHSFLYNFTDHLMRKVSTPARGVITVNPPLRRAGPSVIPLAAPVRKVLTSVCSFYFLIFVYACIFLQLYKPLRPEAFDMDFSSSLSEDEAPRPKYSNIFC